MRVTFRRFWESELQKSQEEENTTNLTADLNIKRKKRSSLKIAILRAFRKDFLVSMVISSLVYVIFMSLLPRLEYGVITYFNEDPTTPAISETQSLLYAAGVMVSILCQVILLHHGDLQLNWLGMKIRVALCSLIYRKVTESVTGS